MAAAKWLSGALAPARRRSIWLGEKEDGRSIDSSAFFGNSSFRSQRMEKPWQMKIEYETASAAEIPWLALF